MASSTSTRALLASAAALAALVAACGGGSGDKAGGEEKAAAGQAHYVDPVGDGGSLPDIGSIDVTSTPAGRITFRIAVTGLKPTSQTGVGLWLDTDANPETGNTTFDDAGGAEYSLDAFIGFTGQSDQFCTAVSGGKGCFAEWTENGWSAARAPTARVSRTESGVTISINRNDLGGTNELNFYAVRGAPPPDFPDRAPGRGTFNYSLALGGPRTEAADAPSESADKAGGKSGGRPVVLTLASHDYAATASEPGEYAAAVERLSGGSVRIDVKYGFRFYDVEYEQGTIADLRHGVVDLALVGARAWDAAGVKSFNALVAPFLVDTYALQGRVLESSAAERMLAGVEPLGLAGVAIIPGELRRPLGRSRALVRPADYRGARIGIRPSGVAKASFAALGAHAEGFPARAEGLAGFDGAESGVNTINANSYDVGARALTANVVLWPRPLTIVMNGQAFDALAPEQQEALRAAGREALGPLLATIQESEQASLAAICRRSHLRLALASPADRAALRRAVQPVYDELERDPLTEELVAEIADLRGEGAAAEPLRCPQERAAAEASALDGVWRVDLTREDLRAAGAQLEQLERAEGQWTVEFDDGHWVARNLERGHVYRGAYTVDGNVLRETIRSCSPATICTAGSVEEYEWSEYRGKLELERIPGRPFNVGAIAKPFTRTR